MKKFHEVSDVRFEREDMVIVIDGREVRCSLREVSPALLTASDSARGARELSPSGYGIHWPLITGTRAVPVLAAGATSAAIVAVSAPG
jgi:hypothetical protein